MIGARPVEHLAASVEHEMIVRGDDRRRRWRADPKAVHVKNIAILKPVQPSLDLRIARTPLLFRQIAV